MSVPTHWRRQLGGTLKDQLAHLRCDVERAMRAAAIAVSGLRGADRIVLTVLSDAQDWLRPREIQDRAQASKTAVNESLQRLEGRKMVMRREVPAPTNTKAFAWRVA